MDAESRRNPANALSYDAIMGALFENYECIYDIDVTTSAYQRYYESDSYSELKLARGGSDFFTSLPEDIAKAVYPEDQEYVSSMLSRTALLNGVKKGKYYTFIYRLMADGEPVYHKIRATMCMIGGQPHILLGVRNIDTEILTDQAHHAQLASIHQKEKNHMEAILGSAAGYLEANLTRDLVLEMSPTLLHDDAAPVLAGKTMKYSELEALLCAEFVVAENEKYAQISNRDYLISCFQRGEKRASVSFSSRTANGDAQPCKKVFYLYQDAASGDILSFCVIYDLTEQQRKEMELEKLEEELRMSRIRNFTSQMQPHFLYNALGSIQEIILDDPQYASELVGDFTVHLRSCIRAMASDQPLPFSQELDNIRAYVNIERMRFGEKLKIRYEIEADRFSIIPLSIQPLVENAIRHGIYERGAAGGTVSIRSRELPEAWEVRVEDDGVGFDVDALQRDLAGGMRDATGLKNIIFRLDKVMHASVTIHSTIGVGTSVTVRIPKGGVSE